MTFDWIRAIAALMLFLALFAVGGLIASAIMGSQRMFWLCFVYLCVMVMLMGGVKV